MIHYVVIATAKRGALKVHEPLDADGQASAWAAYRLDMTVPLERVVWNKGFGPKIPVKGCRPSPQTDRLMELATKARA
jgi:hypothetical protein